jgi:hypothetical protein
MKPEALKKITQKNLEKVNWFKETLIKSDIL